MIQKYFNYNFLFDSHAHMYECSDDEINLIISNAKNNGVELICDVGIDLSSSKKSLEISKKHEGVKSFIGIDPEIYLPGKNGKFKPEYHEINIDKAQYDLSKTIEQNKDYIVGVGETGMDIYWLSQSGVSTTEKEDSLAKQEKLFRMHLELGSKYDLPLTVHSRGSEQMCLEIVKNYSCFVIFHSYTGDYETAKKVLDAGWGLGINGIITFRNADALREVYRKILGKIPSDASPKWFYDRGVYFETDSPFLSPEPIRGEKNQPANVRLVWESLK